MYKIFEKLKEITVNFPKIKNEIPDPPVPNFYNTSPLPLQYRYRPQGDRSGWQFRDTKYSVGIHITCICVLLNYSWMPTTKQRCWYYSYSCKLCVVWRLPQSFITILLPATILWFWLSWHCPNKIHLVLIQTQLVLLSVCMYTYSNTTSRFQRVPDNTNTTLNLKNFKQGLHVFE